MEIKKTEKASLRGNNILYLLGGLNVVLLLVLALFNYQQPQEVQVVEEAPEVVVTSDVVLINIPEPDTPPPPPPSPDEPPPPPPPAVPTEIVETPEPVEVPEIKVAEPTPPVIPTGPVSTGPVVKVDLGKVVKAAPKEERELKPVSVNRVKDMAVYPGCEKYEGNKKELIKCFGKELQDDILRYLDTEFPDVDKNQVAVQLEFHVTPQGEIANIVPKRGDAEFKPQAKEALERAAAYLKRKGKKIKPARMADGTTATLIFNRSVVLQNPE